jgi:hypothetical protein
MQCKTWGGIGAEMVESQMPRWSEFVDLLKLNGELIEDMSFLARRVGAQLRGRW